MKFAPLCILLGSCAATVPRPTITYPATSGSESCRVAVLPMVDARPSTIYRDALPWLLLPLVPLAPATREHGPPVKATADRDHTNYDEYDDGFPRELTNYLASEARAITKCARVDEVDSARGYEYVIASTLTKTHQKSWATLYGLSIGGLIAYALGAPIGKTTAEVGIELRIVHDGVEVARTNVVESRRVWVWLYHPNQTSFSATRFALLAQPQVEAFLRENLVAYP